MSNQNVPWANRGRGGSGVGRGGAGRGGSAEEPSNGDAGADGEEKKASPFGERVKRPGSPAAPASSAAAPEEAASKPSNGLAASSPFGERVRRSTANSIDSNVRPLAGSSPAATTTTTATATATAAPGSPSVPAKAAPSSPFGARVAAKPNPIAITTPAAASEKPTLAAAAGIGSSSPLLKAAIEKSATTQEDEQDDSSGDETDILKRRPPRGSLRGAAPSLIFEQRVAVLANSPRKEKIVYSPEDKQGEPSQEVIESLIPRLDVGDVSSSVEESGSASARLPPKASLLSVETDTMRKRSLTAPAMRESDEASDAEVEVSEQERKLATESAFGEGSSSRQRSGTENMTVVEYLSSATKDSPRLRSATKERVVPKAGLRKKPTRRRSSIASSNKAALLKSDRPYCSMELSSIPMTESSSFAACDYGAMTNSEDLSAVEEVNDDSKAGRGTLKTTGRRFTLSAEDLAKAQLKRKTSSPEQPRPAPVVNAEETVGMLSRLKKSTSAITVKEEKEEAPLPGFGSGLKKVGTKTPASNNETTSPAAPTPGFALKKAASTIAVNKTEEKKDETPSSPFGQLKKTSAPPKEETKPEPAAAPAATGPAWAKNLKKNAEAPKEEEKPKEAPAPAPAAAAATGPAWAKNLKKNTEAAKEEPAPVAVAAAPAVTNSPAWAKKKSGEAAPKEEEKPKEAAAPAAASNSPAWARNLKKPATAAAEPAKEEEKKEPAPSSASNSPAWAKKKAAAEPVKEEPKPAPAPAESSNSPAWAKNLKKPTTVAAAPAVAAVTAEEDKSKVATPPWARKNTAPKEEEKPAPAAASAAAAAPATEAAGGSVSAAAAMFGGRGRGSGVGSGVARGGKFS